MCEIESRSPIGVRGRGERKESARARVGKRGSGEAGTGNWKLDAALEVAASEANNERGGLAREISSYFNNINGPKCPRRERGS